MTKLHLIKNEKIKKCLKNGYLPCMMFIEYLINNVDDFKNIKLDKDIKKVCLKDLNIKKASFFGYNFEYELIN